MAHLEGESYDDFRKNVVDSTCVTNGSDAIAIEIIDHLPWSDDKLFLLRDKINTYIDFVEQGKLYEKYGNNACVLIKLSSDYYSNEPGMSVIVLVENFLKLLNIQFTTYLVNQQAA